VLAVSESLDLGKYVNKKFKIYGSFRSVDSKDIQNCQLLHRVWSWHKDRVVLDIEGIDEVK
jgi:hypothetical protein